MELSKTQEKKLMAKLKHITGECQCPSSSSTCLYWKNVDKGGDWQSKQIIKAIKELK